MCYRVFIYIFVSKLNNMDNSYTTFVEFPEKYGKFFDSQHTIQIYTQGSGDVSQVNINISFAHKNHYNKPKEGDIFVRVCSEHEMSVFIIDKILSHDSDYAYEFDMYSCLCKLISDTEYTTFTNISTNYTYQLLQDCILVAVHKALENESGDKDFNESVEVLESAIKQYTDKFPNITNIIIESSIIYLLIMPLLLLFDMYVFKVPILETTKGNFIIPFIIVYAINICTKIKIYDSLNPLKKDDTEDTGTDSDLD